MLGAGLKPGVPISNCVKVTYTGSLASSVKLYQSSLSDTAGTGGASMGAYLHLKIEEGTGGTFGCSGFTGATTIWDTSTHPGVASDLFTVFPSSYASSSLTSNLASWTNSSTRTYKFTVTLDSSAPDTTQGATVTTTFNWQAQNT